MTVRVYKGTSEVKQLRDVLDELCEHPNIDPVLYFARYGSWESAERMSLVIAVSINGDIAAVAVGRLEVVRIAQKIGPLVVCSQRARVLAVPDGGIQVRNETSLPKLVRGLLTVLVRGAADYVHLACVPNTAPVRMAIATHVPWYNKSIFEPIEPRWMLELPESYEEFLKTRLKKTRAHIKQNERK